MSTAGPEAPTVYDQVLYPSAVFPQTHPNRLATVAFLRGVNPAPIDSCRVLELGCGVGSNLTSMAFHLPGSEFVGLDLARRPIATGQAFITELGLRNIALHALDVCEATAAQFGHFDFIIAHGLYSWVPSRVRERILEICREMLNPQGVAYVSYNAYPGNHLRDMVRGMMLFHTAAIEDPRDKVGQARGLLKFIAESTPKTDYYVAAIRAQFDRTVKYADEAFFHDDLSSVNQSFYFHEFNSDAERHGLQFVGEASSNDLLPGKYTEQVMAKMRDLEAAPEFVREQYKDFIRGTAFRQTLLCHREITLAPDLLVNRVQKLYISCDAAPEQETPEGEAVLTRFVRPGGAELETTNRLVIAALKILFPNWPGELAFETLLAEAARTSGLTAGSDESETLTWALLRAYRTGFLHLHISLHRLTNVAGQRPSTSKLARYQLEHGDAATNQLHVAIKFPDPLSRHLIILLDGTRDRETITQELIDFVRKGLGKVIEDGVHVEDIDQVAIILRRRVSEGLISLGREGMLVS
jgi:methyltransferase-like protein/trans-aconitate methyltransferase